MNVYEFANNCLAQLQRSDYKTKRFGERRRLRLLDCLTQRLSPTEFQGLMAQVQQRRKDVQNAVSEAQVMLTDARQQLTDVEMLLNELSEIESDRGEH